ncbi:MAG: hypothetical protein ABL962_13025 [Fimbriimonadaceae bacterium]
MLAFSFPSWAGDIAWLLFRVGYGLLFINAAWACGKNKAARQWTVDETGIVFPKYTKFFAYCGIAIMGLGGASILLGLSAQWGALALFVFLLPGALIHFRQMKRADILLGKIKNQLAAAPPDLDMLHISARLGHYSSALKNLALSSGCLFIGIQGSGPYSLANVLSQMLK